MWVIVLWNSAWCPTGCRAVWTPCRVSGRTRGTGSPQVWFYLYVSPYCWYQSLKGKTINYLCAALSTVSYMNYGPFTSYAPTYDSSFANISKEDSDLIYSLYGDESSLQGSDRYEQRVCIRTRALCLLRSEAFLTDYFPDVPLFPLDFLYQEEVNCKRSLTLTQTLHLFVNFSFILFLLYSLMMFMLITGWYILWNSKMFRMKKI